MMNSTEPLTTDKVENTPLLTVPLALELAGNDLVDTELTADELPENVLTAEELIANVFPLLSDELSELSRAVLEPLCVLLLLLLLLLLLVVLVSDTPCTDPTSLLVPLLLPSTSVNVIVFVDITVVANGIVFTVLKVELPSVTSSVTVVRLTVVSIIDVFVLTDTFVFVFGVFVLTETTVVGSTETDVVVTVLLFVDTTVSVTLLAGTVETLVTVCIPSVTVPTPETVTVTGSTSFVFTNVIVSASFTLSFVTVLVSGFCLNVVVTVSGSSTSATSELAWLSITVTAPCGSIVKLFVNGFFSNTEFSCFTGIDGTVIKPPPFSPLTLADIDNNANPNAHTFICIFFPFINVFLFNYLLLLNLSLLSIITI
ncbi:hypothetical protein AYI70_g7666 [Smittium culicis]|uniref:Uncharacterized protein n=1 Tax=Smittium culicis TaxID=133412 RepID=A0A1R1XJJ9_9FUNG|nr:hypothetical protein AYI70_g7666 [Smittium culicis]